MSTEHVPVPLHPAPLHPVKIDPDDAVAVSVTVEPWTACPLHVEPQLIVATGLLVTVPVPVPVLLMVRSRAGANDAVTLVAAFIVTCARPGAAASATAPSGEQVRCAGRGRERHHGAARVAGATRRAAGDATHVARDAAGARSGLRHGERVGHRHEVRDHVARGAHREVAGELGARAIAAPPGERVPGPRSGRERHRRIGAVRSLRTWSRS